MHEEKYVREIQRVLNNTVASGKISPQQLKTLTKFANFYRYKRSNRGGLVKITSVWTTLLAVRRLGLYLKKPYKEATTEDLVEYFTLHMGSKSLGTINSEKQKIRVFYKWLYGVRKRNEFPAVVDDERLEPTGLYVRKISPGDLPTKDEVHRMIVACKNPMDKAIVSIWNEMGLRAKEYVSCNVDSVLPFRGLLQT